MVRPLIIHNTLICFYFKLFVTKKTSSRSTAFVSLRVWHCGVGGGGGEGAECESERERERERGLVIPCLIFFLDTQLLFNRGGVCTLSKA